MLGDDRGACGARLTDGVPGLASAVPSAPGGGSGGSESLTERFRMVATASFTLEPMLVCTEGEMSP